MVRAKWLFLIYFGYRAVGCHSPEIFPLASIFGPGATYYDEELKYLSLPLAQELTRRHP
jgi:hypothetical protein